MGNKSGMSPLGQGLFNFAADLSRAAAGQPVAHSCDDSCRDPLDERAEGKRLCFCECHPWNRPESFPSAGEVAA